MLGSVGCFSKRELAFVREQTVLHIIGLFLYSYENEFFDKLIKGWIRKLPGNFNLLYYFLDDLIPFNNKRYLLQRTLNF